MFLAQPHPPVVAKTTSESHSEVLQIGRMVVVVGLT